MCIMAIITCITTILWAKIPFKHHMKKKDLGVIITDKLEVTKQCAKASKKANAMLGMINRTIKYKIRGSATIIQIILLHSDMASIQTKRHKLINEGQPG